MGKAKEISALWSQIKPQIGELVRLCHEVESHAEVTADAYQRGYEEGYKDGYNESGYGRRRDSMGRYAEEPRYNDSYQHDSMVSELYSLMEKAPNEQIKRKYSDFLGEIKGMM